MKSINTRSSSSRTYPRAEQAERELIDERQRAERLAEKLRSLGISPE